MSSSVPYIGSKISLISNSEIRYEGILYTINTQESTIALQSVRCFGTEGRKMPEIPASSEVYDFIIFRGQDIKDLTVLESNSAVNDPAIVSINQKPAGKNGGKADAKGGKGSAPGGSSGKGAADQSGGRGRGWGAASTSWGGSAGGYGGSSAGGWGGWGAGTGGSYGAGGGGYGGGGGYSSGYAGWGGSGSGKGSAGGKAESKGGKKGAEVGKGGKADAKGGKKGAEPAKGGKAMAAGAKGGKDAGKGGGKVSGDKGKGGEKGKKGSGDKGGGKRGGGGRSGGSALSGIPVGELQPEENAEVKEKMAEEFDVEASNDKFNKVSGTEGVEGFEDRLKPLPGYDKTKSFFDSISCEATERAADAERPKIDREKAREFDKETFGDTRRPPRPAGGRPGKGRRRGGGGGKGYRG